MKKYILTIIYNEKTEEVESHKEQIVDLNESNFDMNVNEDFAHGLDGLDQSIVNELFEAATRSGGQLGDA